MYNDWHSLGDTSVFYRKWGVYDLDWISDKNTPISIGSYQICGSPYGGPLALVETSKLKGNIENKLRIYTSAGKKLAEIPWDETKKLAGLGWNDQEQLITVLDDGSVLAYDIHGKLVRNFLLLDSATNVQILECHFWGNGVVAIASDMQIYVAEGLSADLSIEPRQYSMKTRLSPSKPYTSMAIISPLFSKSGFVEVILGTQDNNVIIVDENQNEVQTLGDIIEAPIIMMAVAPNGKFVACYRKDGILSVMAAAFTSKVLDFDTNSVTRPMSIAWCGDDAVTLTWKNIGIVVVGPYGDWLNFPYEEDVHIVTESDCCRIFTSTSCEILQRVPSSTEAIRRIGSTDPAALLVDAMEAFEAGDPKSDENIRSIAVANQLVDAVQSCINAASSEFEVSKQQSLMKAASYGKSFCSDMDPSEFVETAHKLRILNAIRKPNVGLPMTILQYNRLTPEVLINRLITRNHHFLALKISDYLGLKTDKVLVHWGCEKVKKLTLTQETDEYIRDFIKKKISSHGKFSYLEIANAAFMMGRKRLATMILDMEAQASDQVPLLLSMQEEELALQKAINSEDTDLIYLTLIHLERSKAQSDSFLRLIYSHPEAVNLMKVYYRNKVTLLDRKLLHNFLVFGKNYLEAGIACVSHAIMLQSFQLKDVPADPDQPNVSKLQILKEASTLLGQNKELAFQKSLVDEQIDLLDFQKALELRSQRDFIDLNLTETIYNLVLLSIEFPSDASRWEQEIVKITKKFKVSDKVLWHIKIQCYSKTSQWNLLGKLANEKKSPIGYKLFAKVCIEHNQPSAETEKYIDKITDLEDKFELLVEIRNWKKAFDVAVRLKDPVKLQEIQGKSNDPALEKLIQDSLTRL